MTSRVVTGKRAAGAGRSRAQQHTVTDHAPGIALSLARYTLYQLGFGRPEPDRCPAKITITHGEDGHPLPDTSDVVLEHVPVEEDDSELTIYGGEG